MATILEKYDFFLDVPGVGYSQAYPRMQKLSWKWEKSNGFKRKVISNQITFFDDTPNEINDFTKVYPLERERRRCDRIKLIVNKKCNGSSTEFWQGYFYVSDCSWNVSACEFSVKPEANDDYQCIIDRWEEILNLLEYGTPVEIRDTYGEIQYLTCTATRFSEGRLSPRDPINFDFFHSVDCLDEPNSATRLENNVQITTLDDGRKQYDIETLYAREFVSGVDQPPGSGWIQVTDGWARPVDAFLVEDNEGNEVYEVARLGTIPNALLFSEVMEKIFLDFCPDKQFVSNYFGINPDGSNPNNKHYQSAANDYQEQYFIPKSEILYFGASDRATATPEVTLKKLLNDFYFMYGVQLGIRDGKIYLEHESYFKGTPSLDLRHENFEFWMKGNFKYQYINQEIPKIEKFYFADLTDEIGDFDLSSIEYAPCTTVSGNEKPYKCDVCTTNISAIVKSGKKDDGKVSPNGVAIVAADEKVILFATGAVSGKAVLNGVLAFPYIIENNLSYRRPLTEGKLNGKYLQFTRPWPSRRVKSKFCLNCSDLDLFDPDGLVQTCLPWGEVENAQFDEPDGLMSLDTLHD